MARWRDELDLSTVAPELIDAYVKINAEIQKLTKRYGTKMPAEAQELLHELLHKRVEVMRQFGRVKVKK